MTSLILRTAARYLFPLILLFSIYVLFRGHNDPGGGFVGGLAAASAYVLYALAFDVKAARGLLRVDSARLTAWGLLLALLSGLAGLAAGRPFLTARWGKWTITETWIVKAGTPLLFDVGVYLVVLGVTVTILFALAEGEDEAS
ncbi:MAG TPA: Na+/H+ antiporter subunit B [Kiritimatiellia bacterium]|nr:Na+/H+ antiporter subunit B [Kiritimatiellia bacterium]HMO99262.1 Na+/H+ antiporter subunit B [Kiritimatiellia bacterium]HMP96946.1 Na+/H+ antiporter subunit B [Kiritimatiellia bacterium]